jgi:uncharacterized damage-inducible protein DinB
MSADLVERYAKGGELLTYASSGLSTEQLHARPGPGEWSLAELIAHLCDSDLVASDRMKRVIAEDAPKLLAYDENAWIARLRPNELVTDDAVQLFVWNRRWTASILRLCTADAFARTGEHSETGRKTLADLVANYVTHLDYHLKFLYGKRANLGISIYPRYSGD